MARKKFKCSKCDRRFSMAAHLARHANTMHKTTARKSAKKKAKSRSAARSKSTKKTRRKRGSAVSSRRPTGGGVRQLIAQVRALRSELVAQQRELDAQIKSTHRAEKALRRA